MKSDHAIGLNPFKVILATWGLQVVGVYQLSGGIVGITLMVNFIFKEPFNLVLILYDFIAIGLFIYSIVCGSYMLKKNPIGNDLSKVNQVLQVFCFNIWGYAFRYFSGMAIFLQFDLTEKMQVNVRLLLSAFECKIGMNENLVIVGINFFAIIVIVIIEKFERILEVNRKKHFSYPIKPKSEESQSGKSNPRL